MDTMSRGTSEAFFDVIEWAADQPWCSGKVGLLGISYYAGSQWRVAARRPKGLAAIIPWEGMSDYYRDRCRPGGILSNGFIKFWWNRQVITNQYGRPDRSRSKWGEDTIEGNLSPEELVANCRDQNIDNEGESFIIMCRLLCLSNFRKPLLGRRVLYKEELQPRRHPGAPSLGGELGCYNTPPTGKR